VLVIVSDLHLTDNTLGETPSPGAFDVFVRRLRELAAAASWRSNGQYRPIESIDLVLLGDVLDMIRSTRWVTATAARPWGKTNSDEFVRQIKQITSDILDANDGSLQALRGLSANGGVSVPPALRVGRPATGEESEPIPVRVHYMVGNHDWFLRLPGTAYDSLRREVVKRMGLANPPNRPFPHDIVESDELLQTMRRHKVAARHGDLYAPFTFEGDRNASSLGDVIAIELIGRFAAELEAGLADGLPAATVLGLRDIDNVRPLMLVPIWLDGLLQRTCPCPSIRNHVKSFWDRLADRCLSVDFVRQRDAWNLSDLVDGLELALKFGKRRSTGWASSVTDWLNSIRGCSGNSYYEHAMAEQDFRNRRSKHIVYGHTHLMEHVPLDASYADGYVLNQSYFNAGTWRRVHRQTRFLPGENEFIACDSMTYLAFFKDDERSGRPYETWSGTLGFHPSTETIYRVDPGRTNNATGKSLSAPNVHSDTPHFASRPTGRRATSISQL